MKLISRNILKLAVIFTVSATIQIHNSNIVLASSIDLNKEIKTAAAKFSAASSFNYDQAARPSQAVKLRTASINFSTFFAAVNFALQKVASVDPYRADQTFAAVNAKPVSFSFNPDSYVNFLERTGDRLHELTTIKIPANHLAWVIPAPKVIDISLNTKEIFHSIPANTFTYETKVKTKTFTSLAAAPKEATPKVLGIVTKVAVVSPAPIAAKPAPAVTTVIAYPSTATLNKLITTNLNNLIASGALKGAKGDKGDQGPPAPSLFLFPSDPTVQFRSGVNVSDLVSDTLTTKYISLTGSGLTINAVGYSFPAVQGGVGTVLTNDGSGNLSWAAANGGGISTFSTQITSTLATGTAPFAITSTTPVTNLTLSADSQLPTISTAGKVAITGLSVGDYSSKITSGSYSINISGSAPAGSLTGTTLAAGVTTSSLTTVGTIGTGVWNAGAVTSSGAISGTTLAARNTTNQVVLGTTNTVTITSPAPVSSRTYTLPDNASASVNFVLAPTSTTATQAMFATATAGAPAFRAIALTDLPTQTGTGNIVLATSPALTTPNIGAATGTSLSVSGQLSSTVATGTAPLTVTSTTPVTNLTLSADSQLPTISTSGKVAISGLTAGDYSTKITSGTYSITAANVTTNANLTGNVTSVGNATTIANGVVTNAMLAGSIDLTTKVTGILPAGNGGSGNAFFAVSGPATAIRTFTFPNASDTVTTLGATQTNTAAKTFNSGTLLLAGATSGTITVNATATAGSNTITLPAVTGTVITSADTATISNAMLAGSIDLTTKVTGILPAGNGGSGNAFFAVSGPATAIRTFTFPNASDTVTTLGAIQTNTAAKTFNSGTLLLAGATSGTITVNATATAGSNTITLPAVTGTLITSGDTGTVSNTMLGGSIAATKLVGTDIATVGTIGTGLWNAAANKTVASATSAVWDGFNIPASTLTLTGSTTPITTATGVNMMSITQPTLNAAAATTVSNSATVTIANAPAAGTNMTITNAYALWVRAGAVRLDGTAAGGGISVALGSTASTNAVCSSLANATAPTASTSYELRDCNSTPAADYAEEYPVANDVAYGDVVSIGSSMVNTYDQDNGAVDWNNVMGQIPQLVKSSAAYSEGIIGVVSKNDLDFSSTGYNIKKQDNPKSIALVGRVPVRVTSENGAILIGDYLTSSATRPGYAMKATAPGKVIGRALEALSADSSTGKIMVFVHTQDYVPSLITMLQGSVDQQLVNLNMSDAKAFNNIYVSNILYVKGKIYTAGLEVGSAEHPAGITIYDRATKQPFCIVVENGAMKNLSGKCEDLPAVAGASITAPAPTPPADPLPVTLDPAPADPVTPPADPLPAQ